MASFDIQPPEINAPDWTRVSRPIQQPESDKSTGIALSTIGTGIEEGAKLYDTSEKAYLKDKVTTGVDKLRDDYTNAYVNIRNMQQGLIPPQPQTLAQADQPSVPPSLQAGLDRAQQLGIAQAQNVGKVNDTLYTMNLNSLAKQMRAQYPGYKDYIDEQIKSVSGIDPANAVMRNLLEDINRNSTNAKSEHDKITTMVRKSVEDGLPNAAVMASLWDRGQVTSDQVYGYIAKYSSADWQRKQEVADRTNDQGRLTDIQTKVEQSFARTAASDVQSAVDITHIAGGTQTAQGLVDVITKANAEGTKVDPVRLEQGLMGLTALRTNIVSGLVRKANEPDANGQTTIGLIGPDKVNQHIATQLKPIDDYIKYISDEKLGFAHTALRQSTAVQEQDSRDLLFHKDVGQQMRVIASVAKIAPQWGDAMYKAGLLTNLDKKLIPLYQEGLGRAVSQLDPLNPATIKADIQAAKANGVQAQSRLFDNYLNIPKIIADTKAPDDVKLNVAKYAFDPKNWGLMDEIKMDYTNQKRQYVPGKYSAYDRMLSTDIVDGMWKLRQQGGEGKVAWDNMKRWGENEFPTLFREDLHNIARIARTPQTTTYQGTTPLSTLPSPIKNFDIKWDNDNNRFLELPVKGRFGGADTPDNQVANGINPIIRRVNSALSQLSQIHAKENTNTSAYVLGQLYTADQTGEIKEIIQPMMKAIVSSHDKSLQRLEDTFQKSQEK